MQVERLKRRPMDIAKSLWLWWKRIDKFGSYRGSWKIGVYTLLNMNDLAGVPKNY